MSYSESHIAHLLLKQIGGELTPAEALELAEWRSQSPENALFYGEHHRANGVDALMMEFNEAAAQAAKAQAPVLTTEPAERTSIPLYRRSWLRYAAALLLPLGALYLLWPRFSKTETSVVSASPAPEVEAAGYKATLTLADGSTITLDSNSNGTIAQQGNSAVVQTANGEIRYELKGAASGAMMMNTMRTPRGGQFRLTLPDGTKVWLNATSSISYPAMFVAGARKVKVAGEVYFEVAQNKSQPFIVDVDGQQSVEVLGTNFNVNAYKDYGAIKTTLIDGKIKVAEAYGRTAAVVLAPGQQAIQDARPEAAGKADALQVEDGVELPRVLAWKNGVFDCGGVSFRTLMKEIERWYDIDIKYEGSVPDIRLEGKMDRAVSLSGVIRFLGDYGVQAQLDGRTLLIKSK